MLKKDNEPKNVTFSTKIEGVWIKSKPTTYTIACSQVDYYLRCGVSAKIESVF